MEEGVQPSLQVKWKGKNRIGMRLGKLLVVVRSKRRSGDGDYAYWLCKCDCGKVARVSAKHLNSSGNVRPQTSCGCMKGGKGKSKNVGNKHNPKGNNGKKYR